MLFQAFASPKVMERTILPFSPLETNTPPIEAEMATQFPIYQWNKILHMLIICNPVDKPLRIDVGIDRERDKVPEAYERRGNGRSS